MMNKITDTRSEAFSYSQEQLEDILLPSSNFENLIITETTGTPLELLFKDLEYLKKQETRLLWHAITLSEYRRQNLIPRGLRLYKAPSFGLDDPEFMTKWEQTLNKCASDLEVLTIDKCKHLRMDTVEK